MCVKLLFHNPISGSAFQGVTVHVLPAGIGSARCQIFQRQIVQNGGQTESSLCPTVTHVVVDDSMDCDRALRLLKVDRLPSAVYLLKCTWLSTCISEQRLLDTADYSLLNPDKDMETTKDGVKEDVLNSIPLPATQDMKQPIFDETKPDESTETVG